MMPNSSDRTIILKEAYFHFIKSIMSDCFGLNVSISDFLNSSDVYEMVNELVLIRGYFEVKNKLIHPYVAKAISLSRLYVMEWECGCDVNHKSEDGIIIGISVSFEGAEYISDIERIPHVINCLLK